MKRKTQILIRLLFPIPLLIGTFGHLLAGYNWSDSLYGSLCYYFVSVYDMPANIFMEIARWAAPIVTATGIFYALQGVWNHFKLFMISMRKDAVVIYYDDNPEEAQMLSSTIKNSFVEEMSGQHVGRLYADVPHQVIFFGKDGKNLEFYFNHREQLAGKAVYMKLVNLDTSLLRDNDVHFFNILETISVQYWKNNPLLPDVAADPGHKAHVAIIGTGELGGKILLSGLLLNLFYTDQEITYHMFGDTRLLSALNKDVELMNNDRVIMEEKEWFENFELLNSVDRIILAGYDNSMVLEKLYYMCPAIPVYYFTEASAEPSRFFRQEHIYAFGQMSEYLQRKYVMGDVLYTKAKDLHYRTVCPDSALTGKALEADKEKEWLKLDGFMQGSYKMIADYYDLYRTMVDAGHPVVKSMEEMARLEHIRWCRQYYINHWSYGIPENGTPRDSQKRIHRSLVPYEQLNEEDRKREQGRIDFLIRSYEDRTKG